MSNVQQARPEKLLTSGLRLINSMVSTASSTPQLLHSKSRTLESLANCTAKVDQFLVVSRGKEQLALRKQCKYLKNLLVSMSEGIENDDVDVDEFITTISTDLAERATAIDILLSNLCSGDSLDDEDGDLLESHSEDLELGDIEGLTPEKVHEKVETFKQAANKLNRYDRFKRVLATRLPDASSSVPVELPVLVRFGGMRLNNPAILEQVFPGRVDPIGVASKKSSDVGMVLTKQIVMQFSKSYAIEWVKEQLQASPTAERAANSQTIVRNLRKNLQSHKDRLLYEEQQLETSKNVHARARIQRDVDEIRSTIARLESSLERNIERAKEDGSVKRAKTKTAVRSSEAYIAYVKHLLELFAEHGRNYTVLSNVVVTSPSNSDIALVWLVGTSQYKKLAGFNAGEVSVSSWGFPWTHVSVKRETSKVPSSLFLSTKVSR